MEKHHGYLSNGRLAIGIISIVLFIFVTFQSCAAGLGNILSENESSSGTLGVMLSLCMLVGGIIGICTRNSKGRSGPIISMSFYALGAIFAFGGVSTFGDLMIWGMVSLFFGIFFFACGVLMDVEPRQK